ncbi:MAG: hypothetical protein ACI4IF_05160 [Acutalibacteraceae bacterium]
MKIKNVKFRIITALVVIILSVGSLAVMSSAADTFVSYNNKYGQIVPTDSKLDKPKTSFTFYGDSATLYFMRISKGEANANYAVEIYSDKACTELIRSSSNSYGEKGSSPLKITWNLKDTVSGTYYGKCYTYIEKNGNTIVDSDSVYNFTIKIDRLGKKEVALSSVGNTTSGIKITWATLQTATEYRVYRKGPSDKSWVKIASLGKGAYTYTDKNVKSGTKYTYTVRAYDGSYKSLYNTKGLSTMFLSSPTLKSVDGTSADGYAKLTWGKVAGAKGYCVYRKGGTLSDSSWKKIATIKSGSTVTYTDKSATKESWAYTYTVRAYNGSYMSYYDTNGIDYNHLATPKLTKAEAAAGGVKITWTCSDPDAVSYKVYRKTADGWQYIGKTSSKTFTDSNVKSNTTYTYTVRSVAKTNNGPYNSTGIKYKYLSIPTLSSVSFDSKNNATVTWKKVTGAAGYRVYRKTASDNGWTKIADVSGNSTVSYVDKVKKVSGETYTYTVRAFNGSTFSYYNTKGISNMFLDVVSYKVENRCGEDGKAEVLLKWSAVKGAKGYHVYKRLSGQTAWVRIASDVTDLSFTDTTVQNGELYEYTVKAVNGSYSGRYTATKLKVIDTPVLLSTSLAENGIEIKWGQVEGASSYYVYRKAPNGGWKMIGSYSLPYYIDDSSDSLTSAYYYTVRAESEGYKSYYDTDGIKNFATVENFTAVFTNETEENPPFITVKFDFDDTATKVELYKNVPDEEPVLIGEYTREDECVYVDYDLVIGTEYTYTAVASCDNTVSVSQTAVAKYPHYPLNVPEYNVEAFRNEDTTYGINITFAGIENAQGYEIYRKTENTGWEKVADTVDMKYNEETNTYLFEDADIDTEVVYFYSVKAVADDRDSIFDEIGKCAVVRLPLDEPTDIIVTKQENEDGTVYAVITWGAVDGAESYKVIRRTDSTDYEVIAELQNTDACEYTDKTVEQGVKYTYSIVAVSSDRGDSVNVMGAEFLWELPEEPTEEPTEEQPAEDVA